MADKLPDISARLTLDDSQVAEVFAKVGKQSESMGTAINKHSAVGMAGMRGMEVVASDMGRAFGISGEAASVLGRGVGMAASSLGRASVAFGVAGIAAYGAYMLYDHFAESARKLREEIIKTGEAHLNEVLAMDKSYEATGRLKDATHKLYLTKRENALADSKEALELRREELVKMEREINEATYTLSEIFSSKGFVEHEKRVDKMRRKHKEAKDDVDVLEARIKDLEGKTASRDDLFGKGKGKEKSGMHAWSAEDEDKYQAQIYETQAGWAQAQADLMAAQKGNEQEILNARLSAFDLQTAAKIQLMYDEDAEADYLALREMQRKKMVADAGIEQAKRESEHKKRLQQAMWQYGEQITGDLLAMAVSHGKKGAEAAKAEARVRTVVSTAAGAMKAYEQMGPYGAIGAALVIAAGAVQLAKINSASYDSGGGLSFGGLPAAAPPPASGQGPITIIFQDQYGKERDSYTLTKEILAEAYRNNGVVGSYRIPVERSA